MNKNLFVLFLLLCALGQVVKGQEHGRRLIVSDALTEERLAGVKVIFMEGEHIISAGFTNDEGEQDIPSGDKWESVFVEFIGYQSEQISRAKLVEQKFQVVLQQDVLQLDEVVVAGLKTEESVSNLAASVAIVKQDAIAFQNPQSAADLLMQSGKVFVQKSQMGGGSPNLRGFEANKVMIVIDGIRMNNAIYRGGHLQNVITIDPNLIARAEVLFGPSSVQYGSDALGGVMHFISRQPKLSKNEKTFTETNVFTRYSSANQEKSGHFDFNIGFKRWGSLTSVTVSDFGDLTTGSKRPEGQVDQNGLPFGTRPEYATRLDGEDTIMQNDDVNLQLFSGYTQYDFMQKFFFLQSDKIKHDINIQYSTSSDVPRYDRLTERVDGDLRRSEWYYGPQDRFLAAYTLNLFGSRFYDKLNFIASYQDIKESRHTRNFGNEWRNNRKEHVQIASLNLDANKRMGQHRLLYGLEGSWNGVQSTAFRNNLQTLEITPLDTRYPDGGSEMRFLAAYLGDQWHPTHKIHVSGGLRLTHVYLNSTFEDKTFFPFLQDSIERSNNALSANLGFVYNADNGWRFSATASTGFRAPNVDDIGKAFDSEPGTLIVPNPNLEAEYTYNAEISLSKAFDNKFRAEVVGWFTLYDNAIVVRDYTFGGHDSILYEGVLSRVQANQNAKQAILTGFNANLLWQIIPSLKASATYTYTYAQEKVSNTPLDHIPPAFGRVDLTYKKKKWEIQAYSLFNGAKTLDRYSPSGEDNLKFATPEGMPAWHTYNLKAAYKPSKHFQLQLGLENIMDSHYRHFASGISAPGRNLIATLRFKF
jgi:hemoglobin/transferrin/lactoferrin receptor protein